MTESSAMTWVEFLSISGFQRDSLFFAMELTFSLCSISTETTKPLWNFNVSSDPICCVAREGTAGPTTGTSAEDTRTLGTVHRPLRGMITRERFSDDQHGGVWQEVVGEQGANVPHSDISPWACYRTPSSPLLAFLISKSAAGIRGQVTSSLSVIETREDGNWQMREVFSMCFQHAVVGSVYK